MIKKKTKKNNQENKNKCKICNFCFKEFHFLDTIKKTKNTIS